MSFSKKSPPKLYHIGVLKTIRAVTHYPNRLGKQAVICYNIDRWYANMINTLLFDLDGTLIDSNELIIMSLQTALSKFLPDRYFPRSAIIQMIGPPLRETFASLVADANTISMMIDVYLKTYREYEFAYIDIYPHVLEVLDYFKDSGFNLGIVTTKFRSSALPSIKHYGIDQRISTIISLDEVAKHKPDPEPIKKALSTFNNVDQAVMIGDSYSDIIAGKTLASSPVAYLGHKSEELHRAMPDFGLMISGIYPAS